ncbi:hypothetical protein ASG52_14595 [Methylobacterium sp. Leaf456]|uniref:hypothetical protein n=1 Tax=Methylobacterium sp. Leaf456 TaxID=1736382 RepID=UPI0006FFB99A|nr:hypothetical protein [Methylobacterium sp. Leaf456]KQT45393.1 hypothetical protein ASG52_14595 [Methylobacterium sp. Leaf456]
MPHRPSFFARLLTAGAVLALAGTAAQAEPLSHAGPSYGQTVYAASGYGFAGNAVDGTYIGAPFTRIPTPDRLVPPAWGYGTYGVPTVVGIREAPSARPALYVIERQGRAENRLLPRRGAKVVSRSRDGTWTDVGIGAADRAAVERSGAQVVSVRVPGR